MFAGIAAILLPGLVVFSCFSKQNGTAEIDLSCIYGNMEIMQNLLDDAVIGNDNGMYPQASADELSEAIEELKTGISKANAGMFSLQYEATNYCTEAEKAIAAFRESVVVNVEPGDAAELKVFGVDRRGYIDFGESADFSRNNVFSVESWLKYDEGFFEYAIGDFIATFSHDGNDVRQGWMINFMGANLRMTIGVGPDRDRVLESGGLYPTAYGEWMHVVAVYDENAADGQLKMYLNGELFFSKTNDVTAGGVLQLYQPNTRNYKMYAFMEPEDNNRCMSGYIKKFRLWSEAKTQQQVQELMNSEVDGTERNLICAWDFTIVPADPENITDKTGNHTAKLVGVYRWTPVE